jgi:hypothetical protein
MLLVGNLWGCVAVSLLSLVCQKSQWKNLTSGDGFATV